MRERIISAVYLPGEFLQETVICADLGLGRNASSPALQAIEQEGLIEILPRKGILVRPDSLNDILLALETRLLIEPHCAEFCATRASPSDIEAIETLHREYVEIRKI